MYILAIDKRECWSKSICRYYTVPSFFLLEYQICSFALFCIYVVHIWNKYCSVLRYQAVMLEWFSTILYVISYSYLFIGNVGRCSVLGHVPIVSVLYYIYIIWSCSWWFTSVLFCDDVLHTRCSVLEKPYNYLNSVLEVVPSGSLADN